MLSAYSFIEILIRDDMPFTLRKGDRDIFPLCRNAVSGVGKPDLI
jgi:hypothetical protein